MLFLVTSLVSSAVKDMTGSWSPQKIILK